MSWTVLVANAAQKQLVSLPAKDQRRITAALLSMADDPFSGDILKLEGETSRWRRRVGNYRLFCTIDPIGRVVAVTAIARRTSTTY